MPLISPLFTQVSEAAMAAVPELANEMTSYRLVGRLRPVGEQGSLLKRAVLSVCGDQLCPHTVPFSGKQGFS